MNNYNEIFLEKSPKFALRVFFKANKEMLLRDMSYISSGVSEISVCANLKEMFNIYLRELSIDNYIADIELNRDCNGNPKHINDDLNNPSCDLIVHIRNKGKEGRLLCLEMKKSNNYDGREKDRKRLKDLTGESKDEQYINNYSIGIYYVYECSKDNKEVTLEFYRSGTLLKTITEKFEYFASLEENDIDILVNELLK